MARAMQGSAAVLLACVLLLAIAAPSFAAGEHYSSGKHCQRTFRNCARCTRGYKLECAVCEYGYKLHAGTRKRCIADLDGPRCTTTFPNCVKCNAAFKSCRACAYGFKLTAQGKRCEDLSGHNCGKLFPNCATCTPGFRACKRCARGFTLTGKTCKTTQTPQPDDLSGPKCKALDANCALCTTGFKSCAQCVSDYVIDTTTKKCTEDLSGPKCQSLFTNCATCTPKFQACATCAGSFVLNPATKECEVKKGTDFTVSPAAGGSGDLAGVATISFPGDSFDAATNAHIEVVDDDAAAEKLYTETAVFFEPQQRGPSSGVITVTVGDQQPLKDPTVTLTIPAAVAAAATSKEEARLMFLNKWESDIATLDTWEVTNEWAGPVATVGSITATLPLTAFYLSASGNYVASLLLVTTNTAPAGARRRRLLQAGVCDGVSLEHPVDAKWPIPPQGHFGPRNVNLKGASKFHRGVDFAAPAGTPVSAAIDGKVELRSENGGKSGYGHYIIIRGEAGSTLYAHLPPHAGNALVKNGDVVKAGDQIGVSGNSGTGTGAHLHFEYAPAGDIFAMSAKVNPEPCLEDSAVGSIFIGDQSYIADDSFEVKLDGHSICQTSLGAVNTCTLGALRKGSYTLSVVCLVAPDDLGTMGINVLDANMKIDGRSYLDADMLQGQTLTYTLTVT